MNKQKSIRNARTLLRQSELGVLSTHSKANDGFPFGSVSTYMSTVNGDAIFYISDLAQHTRNLLANNKMCLTVFSGSDGSTASDEDPNAGARLSLLGEAKRVDVCETEAIKHRFFKLYPESCAYQGTHVFEFFKLNTERVRFIGGFGDINWINKDAWTLPTPEWLSNEENMVQHMNEDHEDAMQLMCEHLFGINPEHVEMLTLTPDGCFLKADQGKPLFVPFEEFVHSNQEVRQQLVKLTHAARKAVAA
ncbi:MAG: putative heme iron utilization protein [Arenicella sp.]|jgi:putative heme iron utilization protein